MAVKKKRRYVLLLNESESGRERISKEVGV